MKPNMTVQFYAYFNSVKILNAKSEDSRTYTLFVVLPGGCCVHKAINGLHSDSQDVYNPGFLFLPYNISKHSREATEHKQFL